MKKLIAVLIAVFMSIAFVACAAPATSETPTADEPAADAPAAEPAADASAAEPAADGEKLVIGFADFNVGANNYLSTYAKEVQRMFAEDEPYKSSCTLQMLDAQGDADKQLSDIDDLIEMKCDAIVLWPVSSTACISGVQKMHDAGIPIINTNSGVDASVQDLLTCFSGPSDYKQGGQAGEAMIEGLGGSGKVVILEGTAGYDTATQRTAGFMDAVEGKGIEVLAAEPTDWSTEKAQTVMETFLTTYGDQIQGIYCHDDGIAEGAMNALDAVGKLDGSIIITSATMFASGYDALAEGLMYGSILQSPYEDAHLAFELAVKAAKGEEIDKDNRIPTWIVNKKNHSEFDRPTW